MRLHWAALALFGVLITPLGAAPIGGVAIVSSVQVSAGYYLPVGDYPDKIFIEDPCTGNGTDYASCRGLYGAASGIAGGFFVPSDVFDTVLYMSQLISPGPTQTPSIVTTSVALNAYGIASGGTGTGTLTYLLRLDIGCISQSACSANGTLPPHYQHLPGTILPSGGLGCPASFQSAPTPGLPWIQCAVGVIDFTYGQPFDFSFAMNLTQSYSDGIDVNSGQNLSLYNLVADNPDATFQFAEGVPEPRSLALLPLGLLALMVFMRKLHSAQLLGGSR